MEEGSSWIGSPSGSTRDPVSPFITGRDVPRALIEAADLVTEMREVKHPLHTQGIRAQKGIEL